MLQERANEILSNIGAKELVVELYSDFPRPSKAVVCSVMKTDTCGWRQVLTPGWARQAMGPALQGESEKVTCWMAGSVVRVLPKRGARLIQEYGLLSYWKNRLPVRILLGIERYWGSLVKNNLIYPACRRSFGHLNPATGFPVPLRLSRCRYLSMRHIRQVGIAFTRNFDGLASKLRPQYCDQLPNSSCPVSPMPLAGI